MIVQPLPVSPALVPGLTHHTESEYSMSTETIPTAEIVEDYRPAVDHLLPLPAVMPTLPGQSFSDLAAPDSLTGMTDTADLLEKQGLVGTPFIITAVTFRPGYPIPGRPGILGDYVSVEVTTYDNRRVVFNDGSTGVRREIVEILVNSGTVTLGKDQSLDTRYQEWDSDKVSGTWKTGDMLYIDTVGARPMRHLCRKGLRESVYQLPELPEESHTFYLA